jgi:hypothetical protein
VDHGGFRDDVTVLKELLDVLARVGVADLGLLSRIKPYFALANASDCYSLKPR